MFSISLQEQTFLPSQTKDWTASTTPYVEYILHMYKLGNDQKLFDPETWLNMAETNYKLIYFPARFRAEAIRYIFAAAKVPYVDETITQEEWDTKKEGMCSPDLIPP